MQLKRGKKPGPDSFGEGLIRSVQQAAAYLRGENVPVRVTTVLVPEVDVKAIREKRKLSQTEFAARYGFSPASVRNWEQGRRRPDGSARILLAVIDRYPQAVEKVLRRTA